MKKGSFFALAVAGFFVLFGSACEHKQGDQPVVELGGGELPPPGGPGGEINNPPPLPEMVWVVKEMITREGNEVTAKSIYEYDDQGELLKITNERTNDEGILENQMVMQISYAEGVANASYQAEIPLELSGYRFELDEEKRIKKMDVIEFGSPERIDAQSELDYQGDQKQPSTINLFLSGPDGTLPTAPTKIATLTYDERGYLLVNKIRTPPAVADDPGSDTKVQIIYEENGYVDRQKILETGSARLIDFDNSYDLQGRVMVQRKTLGGGRFRVQTFSYDENGNIQTRCEDNGEDGVFEQCIDLIYVQSNKKPTLFNLIPNLEREAIEGIPQGLLPGGLADG